MLDDYDGAILDVMMPKDGRCNSSSKIKGKIRKSTPVLLLTAKSLRMKIKYMV